MNTKIRTNLALLVLIVFSLSAYSQSKPNLAKHQLAKTSGVLPYALMNGNNVTSWVHSDGLFNWLVKQSWNGEFPKGSGVGTVFTEGIVFGGFVNDGLYPQSLRVTGDGYVAGMQPGAIQSDGSGNTVAADDPNSLAVRAFGVRADMSVSIQSNPSAWPDLSVDAATFFQKDVSSVTSADIQQIAAQYFTDWKEWPAARGAPWYVDSVHIVRNDASYDYTNVHHIPGIPGSSKTIWYVSNDQNSAVTSSFAGSPPIGIEEQMTVWAYATSNQLNNMIFKQVKLIYKGNPGASANARIDSMYVVHFSDPDVGDAGDDYSGCDSTLNLGYAYNGKTVDAKYAAVGLPVPAVGYEFLQGASHYTGASNDSAIVNFQWKKGYKYWFDQPLRGFCYFGAGSTVSNPDIGPYSGTPQWFNLMRGDLPRPAYPAGVAFWKASASPAAFPTSFILPGDPTTGAGWIDGYDVPSGDRQMTSSHGPISLNLHDTAEVVIALVNAMGADNLSSVRILKSNAVFAQAAYNQMVLGRTSPPISYRTAFSSPATVAFKVNAKGFDISGISVKLKTSGGTVAGTATLYDDGLHDDGATQDGVFGGSVQISQQQSALTADESVTFSNGGSALWPDVLDGITTAGPVVVSSCVVASDNLNSDGIPNPGENIRITFTLNNSSTVNLQSLTVTNRINLERIPFGQVHSNSSQTLHYDPNIPSTYLDFSIPPNYSDSTFSVPFAITDSLGNLWKDTVRLIVAELASQPYRSPIIHSSGNASGTFVIIVVDSAAIKNHAFEIDGVDSIDIGGHHGITLRDLTANTIVLDRHALPDSLGHTMPVTAGFKILKGTTLDSGLAGMRSWGIPSGARHFTPLSGWIGIGLEGFSTVSDSSAYDATGATGTIGRAVNYAFWTTSLSLPSQFHTVLLKLAAVDYATLWNPAVAPTDPNFSLGYRWLRHASSAPADPSFAPWIIHTSPGTYPYQDFNYSVPFSAWDMDVNPPVRLAVGCFENNTIGGKVDGRYWPPTYATANADNSIAREQAFIFGVPYSTTDNPAFHVDISGSSLPMMWIMSCDIRNTSNWLAGDQFMIYAGHQPSSGDIWTFNPAVSTGVLRIPSIPKAYTLLQNYPNPFNPSTTIRYQLPSTSNVTVKIFNLLGQEVRTLVNGVLNAGEQATIWDSKNNVGELVSSGVYFYRISATSLSQGHPAFVDVKKMVLIK